MEPKSYPGFLMVMSTTGVVPARACSGKKRDQETHWHAVTRVEGAVESSSSFKPLNCWGNHGVYVLTLANHC